MSRTAREKSPIGIYSIKLKSQRYSFSKEDHELFLRCLTAYEGYSILSYLLTKSFLVFIVKEDTLTLEKIMRKVMVKFVCAYKKAHAIDTPIFQERFHSHPAQTMEDVYGMIGKTVNLTPLPMHSELVTSTQSLENDPYIDQRFYDENFASVEDFQEKCHAEIDAEKIARKLSDEELSEFLRVMYQVDPKDLPKMPKKKVVSILAGVMGFTKASARQIARISTLPVRWLWKTKKELTVEKKPKQKKNEWKVTQYE